MYQEHTLVKLLGISTHRATSLPISTSFSLFNILQTGVHRCLCRLFIQQISGGPFQCFQRWLPQSLWGKSSGECLAACVKYLYVFHMQLSLQEIFLIFVNFLQELFHPQELQAMVIGNENYDFHEFEKVRFLLKFRGFVALLLLLRITHF